MGKYCSTAFSLFLLSAGLATAIADPCQIVLLNRCRAVYGEALDATSKGEGGHCFRLQVIMPKISQGMTRKMLLKRLVLEISMHNRQVHGQYYLSSPDICCSLSIYNNYLFFIWK